VNFQRRGMGGPEPSPACFTHQKLKSVANQPLAHEAQLGAVLGGKSKRCCFVRWKHGRLYLRPRPRMLTKKPERIV
jgi:hypothetical protein